MRHKLIAMGLAILLSIAIPFSAYAQSIACQLPKTLPAAVAEKAPVGAVNMAPIVGNILALSWSPQFCRTSGKRQPLQCDGKSGRFGFILHGLWPDGAGSDDPAWCAPADPLPAALVRQNLCRMPSVSLQQHEWAKHGTCMAKRPEAYFKAATLLFDGLQWPDMDRLSRDRATVGQFLAIFASKNPGLQSNMLIISSAPGGWLKEVQICLDTNYKPTRCRRDTRTANLRAALKIWRVAK